jgi:hypothetical protein
MTSVSLGNQDMHLRKQDASNYILIRSTNAGAISASRVVAGVITGTVSASGVLSAGHRIAVMLNGSSVKVYVNDVLCVTATHNVFLAETAGVLFSLTSAVVSNIKTWTLACAGSGIEPTQIPGSADWLELQTLITNNATVTLDAARVYHVNRVVVVPSSRIINLNTAIVHQDQITDSDYYGANLFELKNGTTNVEIYGGTLRGNHLTTWTNAQMSAIDILGTTCANINIHDCTFQNLVGFNIHCAGTGTNIDVDNNNFINCGNGMNNNANTCSITGNYFEDSEGIEASGSDLLIENNTFDPAIAVAISVGGDIGGTTHSGVIVRSNTIVGVEQSNRVGIIAADGLRGALIELNTVQNCAQGIMVAATAGYATTVEDTEISQNTISNCTNGIYMPNWTTRTLRTVIDNNDVDPTCTYGMLISTPNVTMTNNDTRGSGTNKDVLLQVASSGCGYDGTNLHTTIQDDRV